MTEQQIADHLIILQAALTAAIGGNPYMDLILGVHQSGRCTIYLYGRKYGDELDPAHGQDAADCIDNAYSIIRHMPRSVK